MSYMDMSNLYKNQDILLFKECYASEKIHGSSSKISWKDSKINFFPGGEKYDNFIKLFDIIKLEQKFAELGQPEVTIYGEVYGGKCQKMSATYGKSLKFIAFEVNIGGNWLSVPQAEEIVKQFGLEFVHYVKISTDLKSIDEQRDLPSEQAFRNGCADRNDPTTFKKQEGIVLRPIIELRKNNGERIISKHKRDDFQERKSQPEVSPEKLKILTDAQAIADEWVNEMRLAHVLDHVRANKQKPDLEMEDMPDIMKEMVADISKEAKGEILESKDARKAISSKTAKMFQEFYKNQMKVRFNGLNC